MTEIAEKPLVRFSLRALLELIAAIAVVLALIFFKAPSGADRYEMQTIQVSGANYDILVVDRKTGRVWKRSNGAIEWSELGALPNRD